MSWRRYFRRGAEDAELKREIEAHLEQEIAENVARGMSKEEARRRAYVKFGSRETVREEVWRWNTVGFLDDLVRDVRYGLRTLSRAPGFTAVAIATLAIGIGANTAIFSVVNAVLLRQLPFENPKQLVVVWHTPPQKSFPGIHRFVVSPANFLDWQRENHVFSQMSAIGFSNPNLSGLGRPESLKGRMVSYGFFSLLGIAPIAGRGFVETDDQPGHGNVVVLSYGWCENHFGAPENALGKSVELNDEAYTIIGVMPPRFEFPFQAQVWLPLAWTDKERAVRGDHGYIVIARLKGGTNEAQAQAEMNTISERLAQEYPVDDAGWGAVVVPLKELVAGPLGPALLILFGAVGFVLLIACTNVANLLLVRGLGRGKEIAIRSAIGASRGRIVRQVLSETVLLSFLGGGVALLLAHYAIEAIAAFVSDQLPLRVNINLDGVVLAFAMGLCVLTGIITGAALAWHLTRTNVNERLKQGTGKTSADSGGLRARNLMVVLEVALSLVLLAGAGLTIRTLYFLRSTNPGIDPQNVLTVPLVISTTKYKTAVQQKNFFEATLEHVRLIPGVESAGAVDSLPLTGGAVQPVQVEGQPVEAMADQPEVDVRVISPGYLRAMRIPLEEGRDISTADRTGSQPVVLVSKAFAERFWPHEDPMGRKVELTFSPGVSRVVVGVVGDVKLEGLDATRPIQAVYWPLLQNSRATRMVLVVRGSLSPTSLSSAATDAIHQVDPDEPVAGLHSMDEIVDQSLTEQRLSMILLGIFAALALLLAAMGTYGVQSYAVGHRAQEIGIRMALGANPQEVLRLVIGQGLKLTGAGICIGLVAAVALTRLMKTILFGVSATDPITFAGVVVVLSMVALAACTIPARRAMRIDPMVALRYE